MSAETTTTPAAATNAAADKKDDERIAYVRSKITDVPDFPKPGILFKDIVTLLKDPLGLKHCCDLMTERIRASFERVDVVVGIESRGFITGVPVALALGVGFVPIRKPGKLPGKTVSVEYTKEYGTDTLHISEGALQPGQRVVISDDLIATGGSCEAAVKLVEKCGGVVVGCCFIIELAFLKGSDKVERPCVSLLSYE